MHAYQQKQGCAVLTLSCLLSLACCDFSVPNLAVADRLHCCVFVFVCPQVYVLKVINLDMNNQQVRRQVTREVRALDGARHPHVVSYHQSFFAEGAVTILMEFMDGGTLWDLLQKVGGWAMWVRVSSCRGPAAAT
jgi:serine/threonine protein kinase